MRSSGFSMLLGSFVLLMLALAGGCVIPNLELEGAPCPEDGRCGEGYFCIRGVCRSQAECYVPSDCPCESLCSDKYTCVPLKCKVDRDCRCGYKCARGKCVHPDKVRQKCTSHSDCPYGRCFNYCLGPCKDDGDCPSGRSCRVGKCEKLLSEGEPCKSIDDCSGKMLCVKDSTGKHRCRSVCIPGTMSCPSGKLCKLVELGDNPPTGACVPPSRGKKEGASCSVGRGECEENLVCHERSGSARCRKLCRTNSSNCAPSQTCTSFHTRDSQLGICLARECNNSNPCPKGSYCSSGTCLNGCKVTSDCPIHLFCKDNRCVDKQCNYTGRACLGAKYCREHECIMESVRPRACNNDKDCKAYKEICFKAAGEVVKRCRRRCSTGDSGVCDRNEVCYWRNSSIGACYPRRGGGSTGDQCNPRKNHCEWDHVCEEVGTGSFCLKGCHPLSSNCPSGLKCTRFLGSSSYVCMKDALKDENEPCGPLDGTCKDINLVCVGGGTHRGICMKKCNPAARETGCPSSQTCIRISSSRGYCKDK